MEWVCVTIFVGALLFCNVDSLRIHLSEAPMLAPDGFNNAHIGATCHYNNKVFQKLFRRYTPLPSFLQLSASLESDPPPPECEGQVNVNSCAMVTSLAEEQDCAWCMSPVQTSKTKCISREDVPKFEALGMLCAPHASREDLGKEDEEDRVGLTFSLEDKSDELFPPHHAPWGHQEFCSAMEVFFGATASLEEQPALEARLGKYEYDDLAGETKKATKKTLDANLKEIWTSPFPGEIFEFYCVSYFGEICQHECLLLSKLFDAASRPGVEAFAGAPDRYTADWEMSEGDYVQSEAAKEADEKGAVLEGGLLIENQDRRGRAWLPAVRQLKIEKDGEIRVLDKPTTRRLHYRLGAGDCMRCLTESVCTPECLVAGTPCGIDEGVKEE